MLRLLVDNEKSSLDNLISTNRPTLDLMESNLVYELHQIVQILNQIDQTQNVDRRISQTLKRISNIYPCVRRIHRLLYPGVSKECYYHFEIRIHSWGFIVFAPLCFQLVIMKFT